MWWNDWTCLNSLHRWEQIRQSCCSHLRWTGCLRCSRNFLSEEAGDPRKIVQSQESSDRHRHAFRHNHIGRNGPIPDWDVKTCRRTRSNVVEIPLVLQVLNSKDNRCNYLGSITSCLSQCFDLKFVWHADTRLIPRWAYCRLRRSNEKDSQVSLITGRLTFHLYLVWETLVRELAVSSCYEPRVTSLYFIIIISFFFFFT